MISTETFNNVKYYSKIVIIFLVIFLLLYYIVNLKPFESILLALIITVIILIIENILILDHRVSDSLDCGQCSIIKNENHNLPNSINEPFITSDLTTHMSTTASTIGTTLANVITNLSEYITPENSKTYHKVNPTVQTLTSEDEKDYEFKCIRVKKTNENSNNIENFDNFLEKQTEQNNNLITTSEKINNATDVIIDNYMNNHVLNESSQQNYIDKLLNNNSNNPILSQLLDNNNEQPNNQPIQTHTKMDNDAQHFLNSNDYTTSQEGPLNNANNDMDKLVNTFRLSEGNQQIAHENLVDGQQYYNKIFTRSSSAPTSEEALNSELKYGDLNYIGPLNKGMINKEYTFISPTNWYPIQPRPPVCVAAKKCTTCPVVISNGSDYMQFAPLDEFENSRRFTGNMGINTDYVKNVLNNDGASQ